MLNNLTFQNFVSIRKVKARTVSISSFCLFHPLNTVVLNGNLLNSLVRFHPFGRILSTNCLITLFRSNSSFVHKFKFVTIPIRRNVQKQKTLYSHIILRCYVWKDRNSLGQKLIVLGTRREWYFFFFNISR